MKQILPCPTCQGEGRIWKSKYGGNDPDVWDAGQCPTCEGAREMRCDVRKCKGWAVGFNEDGEAMCEDCLAEWIAQGEAETEERDEI